MTKEIQEAICKAEALKFNIPCENVKYLISSWEYDVLSLNKGGNITEFEVKISRSDFLADKRKRKFKYYNGKHPSLTPNRFYYVCPAGLISPDEIPSYAGLIYFTPNEELVTVRAAALLSRHKHDVTKIKDKFLRVQSERLYLGACRTTYENNLSKAAFERTKD